MSLFLKFAAFFASIGFFISLVFGLLSGNSSISLLLTAFICSIICAVIGAALCYLLKRQVPELLELVLQGAKILSQQPYSKDARESEGKSREKSDEVDRNRNGKNGEDEEQNRAERNIAEGITEGITEEEIAKEAEIEKSKRKNSYLNDLNIGRQFSEPDLGMQEREVQTVELRKEAHKSHLADTIQIKNEPKLMAEAIRTMILKDD